MPQFSVFHHDSAPYSAHIKTNTAFCFLSKHWFAAWVEHTEQDLSRPTVGVSTSKTFTIQLTPLMWNLIYIGSAGILFPVKVYLVLHFRFVAKTVSVAHQSFGYCWAVLGHSHSSLFLPLCLRTMGRLLGRCNLKSGPELAKGIFPYHITSCLAMKAGAEKGSREEGCLQMHLWLRDWLGISLCRGGGKRSSLYHLFLFLFLSLIKVSSCQPMSSLSYTLLILSSIPQGRQGRGREQAAVWMLKCRLESIHHDKVTWNSHF